MTETKFRLPEKVYVISNDLKKFFKLLAHIARMGNKDDLAVDMDWYADGWFYDAEKFVQDYPECKDFVGKFIVFGEFPSKTLEAFKSGMINDQDGEVIKWKPDA